MVRRIWRLAFMRKDGAGLMRMASYGGGLEKVGWQETLEDLEKLLEEAKELCEKRSGGLLLSRIILGVKRG